jgi:hypothetical protein
MIDQEKNFSWKLEKKLAILSTGDIEHEGFDLTLLKKAMARDDDFETKVLFFVCKQKLSNKKADTKGLPLEDKIDLMKDMWASLIKGEWAAKKTVGPTYDKAMAATITTLHDVKLLVMMGIPLTEAQQKLVTDAEAMQAEEDKKNKGNKKNK